MPTSTRPGVAAPPRSRRPAAGARDGYLLVDWIADYMERVGDLPVLSTVEPGWVAAQLPDRAPEQGEPWEEVMADVDRIVLPGITHWQSPGFYAFFPATTSGPSILGELLSAGLGVQGMLWVTSPACTEIETVMLDWMAQLPGLPDGNPPGNEKANAAARRVPRLSKSWVVAPGAMTSDPFGASTHSSPRRNVMTPSRT